MGNSFKDMLNARCAEELSVTGAQEIVTSIGAIAVPSEDTTLEEAEKIWPMLEASLDISKGYGLAAIQIGIAKKVAFIRYGDKTYRLLNTRIIDYGPSMVVYNEGCLSIPGKTVNTVRASSLKIRDDALGELEVNVSKDGLLPFILQHEVDHFNGQIIFDRVRKPIRVGEKVGRNDVCPCGSGKKYKKCCINK